MSTFEDLKQAAISKITKEDFSNVIFNSALDIACADKKSYSKPEHLVQIQSALEQSWDEKTSIALSMPSRWGKTELVTYHVCKLLWDNPALKILWAGYNTKLSSKAVRNILRITKRFRPELLSGKQTGEFFETIEGGYVLATSPTSTASGYGASIVVIEFEKHDECGISNVNMIC